MLELRLREYGISGHSSHDEVSLHYHIDTFFLKCTIGDKSFLRVAICKFGHYDSMKKHFLTIFDDVVEIDVLDARRIFGASELSLQVENAMVKVLEGGAY